MSSTVLTLALEDSAHARFEGLRRQHFPAALNRIPAHLTLFHTLPLEDVTHDVLTSTAAQVATMRLRVAGILFLGRGVAYAIVGEALTRLHQRLAEGFEEHLSAQDRQRFRPHIVVQNKVTPVQARVLSARLQSEFEPWTVQAVGLDWWEYLGGPWRLIERMPFAAAPGIEMGC